MGQPTDVKALSKHLGSFGLPPVSATFRKLSLFSSWLLYTPTASKHTRMETTHLYRSLMVPQKILVVTFAPGHDLNVVLWLTVLSQVVPPP